ncbi:MAG: 50S ribosomal protein L27 [Candidatus Nasuia deltocephalinicola]
MAQKKSGGSSKNGRDSNSKKLGFKKFNLNFVKPGNIILRQKGSKILPGLNSIICKDYTIISLIFGYVYVNRLKNKIFINVI